MASPTPPPHYSLPSSKSLQNPHPPPQNPLQNPHKTPYRLHSSSSTTTTAAATAAATNTATTPTITTTPTPTTPSGATNASSPSHSPQNPILQRNPAFLPYCPRPRAGLSPEFRRTRTTRVISKRNFSSAKPSPDNARTASPAANRCLSQILRSAPNDRALANILSSFRPSLVIPEDYCFILHELGDRDKCPPKALRFFHSAMPLMQSQIEQGKLLTAAICGLGKMGRPELARQVFDVGVARGYGNTVFAYSSLISAYARSGLAAEAMGVFERMKAAGLRPTTISYNAVIDACGKGGVDFQFTLGFFRDMLHDGLCPM